MVRRARAARWWYLAAVVAVGLLSAALIVGIAAVRRDDRYQSPCDGSPRIGLRDSPAGLGCP
jgi:hypothetical protein